MAALTTQWEDELAADPGQLARVEQEVHHVSVALESLQLPDETRQRIYQRLRQHLRRGRVDRVITELARRASGKYRGHEVWREIEYFTKHADHMAYAKLRGLGLAMGWGAIDSAIRRVVNQRLKGNGIWIIAQSHIAPQNPISFAQRHPQPRPVRRRPALQHHRRPNQTQAPLPENCRMTEH